MPLTATFTNRFTAVFTPPNFGVQITAPPLLTELDAILQTESSQDISVDQIGGNVPILTATRIGLNTFRVSGVLST